MINDDGVEDDALDPPQDFGLANDADDDRSTTVQHDHSDDGQIVHGVDGLDDDVLDGGFQPDDHDAHLVDDADGDDGDDADDAGGPRHDDVDVDSQTSLATAADDAANDDRADGRDDDLHDDLDDDLHDDLDDDLGQAPSLGGWLVPAPDVPAALLMPADSSDAYQVVDDPSTGSALWAGETFGLDQLAGYTDLNALGVAEPAPASSG